MYKLILQAIKDALQDYNSYTIAPNDSADLTTANVCLFVGTGGNIKVDMYGSGTGITFYNIPDGSFLPIRVKKVYATGTTASNIVGIY